MAGGGGRSAAAVKLSGYQTGCWFLFKYFRGVLLEIIANMMYSTLQFKRY